MLQVSVKGYGEEYCEMCEIKATADFTASKITDDSRYQSCECTRCSESLYKFRPYTAVSK